MAEILRFKYYLVCPCGCTTCYITCDHPVLDKVTEFQYICTNCGEVVREIVSIHDTNAKISVTPHFPEEKFLARMLEKVGTYLLRNKI